MKTRNIILASTVLLALILSVSLVTAAVSGPAASITGILENVFTWISEFFSLKFLNNGNIIGFLRFLLWITAFMLFYGAGRVVFGKMYQGNGEHGTINRNAGILAAVIATVTIIFIPNDLLTTLWESYAVIVIFLFLLVPIAAVLWFIYPGIGSLTDNQRAVATIRILGLLLIWYILSKVSNFGDKITGTVSFRSIISISALYIWNKYFNNKE